MNEKKHHLKYRINIWGIILLLLGVVFLLQNLNILPAGLWTIVWRFWPLFLIISGVNTIIGKNNPRLAEVIAIVLLVIGILAALLLYPLQNDEFVRYSAPRGNFDEAVIDFDISAGSLNLSALPYGSPNLVEADSLGIPLRVESSSRNGMGIISFESVAERRMRHRMGRMGWNEWDIKLARDIPLSIDANFAAVDIEFDLEYLNVTRLDLDLDAGNVELVMPAAEGIIEAFIQADAANVEVTIPDGVAAKIRVDVDAGILDLDENRFVREGAYYISNDFDEAESQVYLEIDLNAGRVKVS